MLRAKLLKTLPDTLSAHFEALSARFSCPKVSAEDSLKRSFHYRTLCPQLSGHSVRNQKTDKKGVCNTPLVRRLSEKREKGASVRTSLEEFNKRLVAIGTPQGSPERLEIEKEDREQVKAMRRSLGLPEAEVNLAAVPVATERIS